MADLRARIEQTTGELGAIASVVRDRAVQQYIRGSAGGMVLDTDLAKTTRANALARFVALGDDDAIDEYQRLAEDLVLAQGELDAAKAQSVALVADMQARTTAAFNELRKLTKLEADRKAREAQQRAAAASRSRTSGRRSGPTFIAGNGSWMCPVQGPHAFSNDWGDARSGGRRHQGNDILAPRGTPVVASVSGNVKRHNSSLGGLSYYLTGSDGNEYYGAHLDSYVGGSGHVAQGTVIGYVGNSGNARGGPTHLHFEIHPGGGRPVNPYPTLQQYC
jgi:murein DD-endopeptidase MepM/ murein hydrolase activator NlpD